MAILWEDDLEGSPTSGLPTTTELTWATWIPNAATAYTAATVNGMRAIAFGPGYGSIQLDQPSDMPTTGRLRFLAQWSGTQTAHHLMTHVKDVAGGNLVRADAQIRNGTSQQVWNRWNFVSAGNTTSWAQNTPWRFEYRWQEGVGTLLEVWTDPNSSGEPDWAITAAGTEAFDRLEFGNTNTTSGLTVLMGGLAMSEGERIGPVVSQLDTPVATVSAASNPSTIGGADGSITVTWPAVSGAGSYEAGIATGLNQTSGFTIDDATATSPHTFTGLTAGPYTVGIRANP